MELNHNLLYYVLVGFSILAAELLYFWIAGKYGIMDKPNERSSHARPAIRGGGIVFIMAVVIWFVSHEFTWPWFVLGAFSIAFISFLDDVITLKPIIRILIQVVAVLFMFYQLWPISWPVYLVVLAVIVSVGALNTFNFMDGINGITGVYALVSLCSFGYIHTQLIPFTDFSLILVVSISVLIFLFFNFRKRARCFAGDIGSITIAFILIFFLIQLIQVTNNFLWPLLFLVYGTDSIVTIIYRIRKGENIFEPHRTHLFQYLSNELKWPHSNVSLTYGIIQVIINLVLFVSLPYQNYFLPVVVALLFVCSYLIARVTVIKKNKKLTV